MRHHYFLTILSLFFTLSATAQYEFTVATGTYTNLVGSTSLNDGEVWDDPQYAIPIGFEFQLYDELIDEIFIGENFYGGVLTTASDYYGISPLIVAYGTDIIDRGYEDPYEVSLSNISYMLEGEVGSQILKIEWNNAGFYGELTEDDISTDFLNFQLWLYEGSNNIEIHFGPSSVTQPEESYEGDDGPWVGLISEYDRNNDYNLPGIVLTGDPTAPDVLEIGDYYDVGFLDGTIPDGTIYRFSNAMVDVGEHSYVSTEVRLVPNPADDVCKIIAEELSGRIEDVTIMQPDGSNAKSARISNNQIDLSGIASGMYLVRIGTDAGIFTKKLIVR